MRFRRRYEVVVQGESGSAISQLSVISEHRNERDAREAAALERRRLEMIRAEEAASWVIMVMRGDEVLHEERPFGGRREDAPVPPVGPLKITQRESPAEPRAVEATGPPDEAAGVDGAPSPEGGDEGDATDGAQTGTIPALATDPAPADEPAAAEAEEPGPAGTAEARTPAARGDEAPPAHAAFAVPEDIVAPEGEDAVPAFLAEPSPASAAQPPADGGSTGQAPRSRRDADIPSGPVPDDVIRRFEEAIAREKDRERERGTRRP
ncbi:MAG: hypothetical protein ACLGG9_02450 [Thermoleophilia bacterium]